MRRIALHWWILIAMALGALVGVAINAGWSPDTWRSLGVQDARAFVTRAQPPQDAGDPNAAAGALAHASRFAGELSKFIGDLFVRLLRLVAVPVVLFSLVAAVAGVGDLRTLGRLGVRTLGIFALASSLAVVVGLALANTVRPGVHVSQQTHELLLSQQAGAAQQRIASADDFASKNTIWSQLLDVIPPNPFQAFATANMLQVVAFALLLGLGLTLVARERRLAMVQWCDTLAEACLAIIGLVLKGAPVAVFCLTATMVANLGWSVLAAASVFVLAVITGLAIVLLGVFPGILVTLGARENRISVRQFFRSMAPAHLLAFSSSSSAATLPVTMRCCEAMRLPRDVTSFVLPLGTTINMGGTALYQVMSVIFLAQLFGVDLSLADQLTIAGMALLVAVGSPGLPGASLVLMIFILEAVRIPPTGIAIIIAVDRVLDMARTVVNVSGDAATAVVVAGSRRETASAQ